MGAREDSVLACTLPDFCRCSTGFIPYVLAFIYFTLPRLTEQVSDTLSPNLSPTVGLLLCVVPVSYEENRDVCMLIP